MRGEQCLQHRTPNKWLIFVNVALGTFMATLDSSIVNVALPTLATTFGAGVGPLQWVVTTYLLTISSTLPAFGRLGDIIGRRVVYIVGFVLFVAGSALCGLAGSLGQLVGFRVIQALGASMLMANNMAIVVSTFPVAERGKALGLMGSVVSAGSLTGPALGGLLVAAAGWRSIFYVNVPIGLMAATLGLFLLPVQPRRDGQRFDFAGAGLFAGGMITLLLALSSGREAGWLAAPTVGLLAGAVLGFAAFTLLERRTGQPVIDLDLFRIPLFTFGNLAGMLSFVAMFFSTYLVPFFLSRVLGLGPRETGVVMMSFPAAMIVTAPISGWLSDRIGPAILTAAGMGVIATALAAASRLPVDASPVLVAACLALAGAGSGLFQSPNNSSIMGAVPPARSGITGGLIATVRNVGMMLGVALAATIFSARLAAHGDFREAFGETLLVGAAVAVLGMAVTGIRGRELARKGHGSRRASTG